MRNKDEGAEFGERAKKFLPKTLADQLPALRGAPNRPVIAVHRIERDTSGLVAFARTREAAESLMKQFRKHTVDRRYLALTRGVPAPGRIESILVGDRGDGRASTRKTNPPNGSRAVTHVKILEPLGNFALVECRLETGRTHQVRIIARTGARSVARPFTTGREWQTASGWKRRGGRCCTRHDWVSHPETGEAMMWKSRRRKTSPRS